MCVLPCFFASAENDDVNLKGGVSPDVQKKLFLSAEKNGFVGILIF